MTSAVRLPEISPQRVSVVPKAAPRPPLPLPAHGDELGPNGRRWLTGGVLLAHLAGGWALLQIDAVREVVAQVAPTIMVDTITPAEAPKPPPPPPPPAKTQPPPQNAPAPLIAAAATPAPAPATFTVPPPEPAPPAPVLAAPAPPAPPAPPVVQAPPPVQTPKKIPGTALRYLTQPRLNFPLLSRRTNESGDVTLRIVVDVHGRLKDASVLKSSGFARIDQAALQDIRSARFVPYTEDGQPVEVESSAVLAYDLDR